MAAVLDRLPAAYTNRSNASGSRSRSPIVSVRLSRSMPVTVPGNGLDLVAAEEVSAAARADCFPGRQPGASGSVTARRRRSRRGLQLRQNAVPW
jgi:hypothetical protein